MTRTQLARFTNVAGVALLSVLALAPNARAQAWVPARGEGGVAVSLLSANVKEHILTRTRVDVGQIDTFVMLTDVTYGVTDKVAVDVAIPLVTSKYTGTRPHPTALDNGSFHSTFSDFRVSLRYNLMRGGAVITPYIGTVVPSHDYEFYAHAAPGERLREVQAGAFVAKLFDRGIPGMVISGRYAYGFTEQVLDIAHNRSMGNLEVGYFVNPSLRVFAMGSGQYTHGGVDIPPAGLAEMPAAYRPVHDQIDRAHNLNLGAGAAYSLTDSVDVFGSFVRTITGRNEHALNRAITVGASWGFNRKSRLADSARGASTPDAVAAKQEGSLARCTCQKSGL